MKGGILEVLLVSAEGIRHTNLIGKSVYYVIIECGTQVRRSKSSEGKHKEVCWNEKFTFEFPSSEWERENFTHLKFRIMDEEFFTDGGFVGETIVCLEGIMMEGNEKRFIELRPAPYNVVLEDDTYRGEIKIGLKFIPNKVVETERKETVAEQKKTRQSIFGVIINLCNIPWLRRLLFFYRNTNSEKKQKHN